MDVQGDHGLDIESDASREWAVSKMAQESFPTSLNHTSDGFSIRQSLAHMVYSLEHRLTQIMLTSENTQTALQRLSALIEEVLPADCCSIAFKTFSSEALPVHWRFKEVVPVPQLRLSSLLHHPACQGWESSPDPIAIADLHAFSPIAHPLPEALPNPDSWSAAQHRAVLVTRTLFQGRVNGAMIITRSRPHHWTESEVQLLKTISHQVAIAISQAQLEHQVQQQVQYQSLIDQLTRAVRNDWNLDQVFRLALAGVTSALEISRGLVLLVKYTDPLHKHRTGDCLPSAKVTVVCEFPDACESSRSVEYQHLNAATVHPETGTRINQSFWVADCDVCQQLFTQNPEPIAISSPSPEGSAQANCDSWTSPIFNPVQMPALLLVPLENQGTILGCLALQHNQLRFWHPEEIAFLKLVAAQLSTAIIQSRTLRQVQALVDERTAQLQHSLDVQAKLYERTRQQVEQLRRLNAVHEEFLSTMSHELLTPLTSMTLAIRMLRQAELSPDRQARYLDILEQQCLQETSLINDLLALQKLETKTSSLQLQKLDIKFLVRDLMQSLTDRFVEHNLALEVVLPERPLQLFTDVDSLHRILLELLTNAKKYSIPNTVVRLEVAHEIELSTSRIVVSVTNIGSGIPPEEMPYIFDKFRRGRGVTQQAIQGTGLGLALVKGLAEHLSGAIAVSSQPLGSAEAWETRFTLFLPLYPEGFMPTSA
jgi:signal transduction histidine kinase